MMLKLTDEQRQAAKQQETPLRLLDEQTATVYVLLRADHYDRIKSLFEEDPLSAEEQKHLLREFGRRAGWDDPAMDIYNDLDPRRQS